MTSVRSMSLTGSCLCGGVKFELTETPETMRYCHCESCKKLSGSGGTTNLRVSSSAVRVLEGDELVKTFQPSEGSSKSFCSVCGSNLFGGGWPDSPTCSVRASALDDPFEVRPSAHTWVRSVAPWETLPDDGLDRFETTSG